MSKTKVLLTKLRLESDGATKVIYDLISTIKSNSNDFEFDWFLYSPDGHTNAKQFKDLGCKIYFDKKQKERKKSKIFYHLTKYIRIIKFLKRQKYDVIHINTDNMFRFDMLACARLAGIPVRIIHSHNSQSENLKGFRGNKVLQKIARFIIDHTATVKLACSKPAAEWMYSKKGSSDSIILKNGIDTDRFRFNESSRISIRREYNIDDDTVLLGNVGRFVEQKNQLFLINVFSELLKINPSSRLLLIGEGKLELAINNEIRKLNLQGKVIMPGTNDRINDFYSAMDIFVFPSLFEGLGIVAIEAQTSGLQTVCSNVVPTEVKLTDLVEFVPLSAGHKKWAQIINNLSHSLNITTRNDAGDKVKNAGYDKNSSATILKNIYLSKH